ncbi:MAG: GC-type dockerin domain-anchored protein [Phycisphaerales bacterium]
MTTNCPRTFGRLIALAIPSVLGLLCANSAAQVVEKTVAYTGELAPGTSGDTFLNTYQPILGNDGLVVFSAVLFDEVPGGMLADYTGIWAFANGVLSLIVAPSAEAPGTGGASFGILSGSSLRAISVNSGGEIAFSAPLKRDPPVTVLNDGGIWAGPVDNLTIVAREGDPAPGLDGPVFSGLGVPALSDSGRMVFEGSLRQGVGGVDGSNDTGIWVGDSLGLELLARKGDPAPGTGGAKFDRFYEFPIIDAGGDASFTATLLQDGVYADESNDSGIWAFRDGAVTLVAREGDIAPGTDGARFFDMTYVRISTNSSGDIAFGANLLEVPGMVDYSNNVGIWLWHDGVLGLVTREAMSAYGVSNAIFSSINDKVALNASGAVAFEAFMEPNGDTVDDSNRNGIWIYSADEQRLAAREGWDAPGLEGKIFSAFHYLLLNDLGDVLFYAQAANPGNTYGRDGIWYARADTSEIVHIVHDGEAYDLDDHPYLEDLRYVTHLEFPASSTSIGNGRGVGLNNSRQVSLWLWTEARNFTYVNVLATVGESPCSFADLAEPYGEIDFSDVFTYLQAFAAMESCADLGEPYGLFDFSDIFAFLQLFGAGCP